MGRVDRNKDVLPKRRMFLTVKETIPNVTWDRFIKAYYEVDTDDIQEEGITRFACSIWDCVTPLQNMTPEEVRKNVLEGDAARELLLFFEDGVMMQIIKESPFDGSPLNEENTEDVIAKILDNVRRRFFSETIIDDVVDVIAEQDHEASLKKESKKTKKE